MIPPSEEVSVQQKFMKHSKLTQGDPNWVNRVSYLPVIRASLGVDLLRGSRGVGCGRGEENVVGYFPGRFSLSPGNVPLFQEELLGVLEFCTMVGGVVCSCRVICPL